MKSEDLPKWKLNKLTEENSPVVSKRPFKESVLKCASRITQDKNVIAKANI